MPTYEYCCDTCTFRTEEFMSMTKRNQLVGSSCPADKCDGLLKRAVSASHVQDVLHTEQSAVSRGLLNPTGAFREKMQQIIQHGSQVGAKQKRELKDHFNL